MIEIVKFVALFTFLGTKQIILLVRKGTFAHQETGSGLWLLTLAQS